MARRSLQDIVASALGGAGDFAGKVNNAVLNNPYWVLAPQNISKMANSPMVQKVPQIDVAKNIDNPFARAVVGTGEYIANTPMRSTQGAGNMIRSFEQRTATPQSVIADSASIAELPLMLATFGGGAAKAGVTQAAQRTLGQKVAQGAFGGLKSGAFYGGLSGLEQGRESTLTDQFTGAAKNAAIGGVVGAAIGGATPLVSAGFGKAKDAWQGAFARPDHQKLLEDAIKSGDLQAVGKILDAIPDDDPYKKPMESLFRPMVDSGNAGKNIEKNIGNGTPRMITKEDYLKAQQPKVAATPDVQTHDIQVNGKQMPSEAVTTNLPLEILRDNPTELMMLRDAANKGDKGNIGKILDAIPQDSPYKAYLEGIYRPYAQMGGIVPNASVDLGSYQQKIGRAFTPEDFGMPNLSQNNAPKQIVDNVANTKAVGAGAVSKDPIKVVTQIAQDAGDYDTFRKTLNEQGLDGQAVRDVLAKKNLLFSDVWDKAQKLKEKAAPPVDNPFRVKGSTYPTDGGATDQLARERFNIPSLKELSAGSDRKVFEMADGKVLKVAKTARGMAQLDSEGDYYAASSGLIPNIVEKGKNYIVMEKVNPPDQTVKTMVKELGKLSQEDIRNKTGSYQDILDKYGINDLLDYDVLAGDIQRLKNWGTKDGKPIMVDGGSLSKNAVEDFARAKQIGNNPVRATDSSVLGRVGEYKKDFSNAAADSKALKKQFGDTDAYKYFGILPAAGAVGTGASNYGTDRGK